MALPWDMSPPPGAAGTWNGFFMLLSLMMAILGAYSAMQFIEVLVVDKQHESTHVSKRGSVVFPVFAAAWAIGVNSVWLMHFIAMSAVTYTSRPVQYNVPLTFLSL